MPDNTDTNGNTQQEATQAQDATQQQTNCKPSWTS